MSQMSLHQTIKAPRDRVWASIQDIDSWGEWMSGFVGIEKLTTGEFGVGTRWKETRKMMGHEATEHFEVTAFDPPHTMTLFIDGTKGSSGCGEYSFVYRLKDMGEETLLTLDGTIKQNSFLAKIMGWLMGGMMKKAIAKDLSDMAAFIERNQ